MIRSLARFTAFQLLWLHAFIVESLLLNMWKCPMAVRSKLSTTKSRRKTRVFAANWQLKYAGSCKSYDLIPIDSPPSESTFAVEPLPVTLIHRNFSREDCLLPRSKLFQNQLVVVLSYLLDQHTNKAVVLSPSNCDMQTSA